eukprot:TRINITY_DN2675_c0_g1_i1.p1 TRINITY_DN2675_c0_g1~~TRINITY_DN2675_c0_g1_i1.p1  ORF type:complete len:241 (+),score=48.36 TRINITY_DN2675_c0_g1_i1:182-904(+)
MPVSINTGVYQSFAVVVYILSIVVLKEKPTMIKTASVIGCMVGVVVLTVGSTGQDASAFTPAQILLGSLFCLGASWNYGIFEVMVTKHLGHMRLRQVFMFWSLIAMFSSIIFLPVFWIVDAAGLEPFHLPRSEIWIFYLYESLCQFGFLCGFFIGIAAVGPVYMTLGSIMTLPGSAVFDSLFKGVTYSWVEITGLAIIGVSFICMNLFNSQGNHDAGEQELSSGLAKLRRRRRKEGEGLI